jgi:hypothetical protein
MFRLLGCPAGNGFPGYWENGLEGALRRSGSASRQSLQDRIIGHLDRIMGLLLGTPSLSTGGRFEDRIPREAWGRPPSAGADGCV